MCATRADRGRPDRSRFFSRNGHPTGGRSCSSPIARNWWNLYRYDLPRAPRSRSRRWTAEFGVPQWSLGSGNLRLCGARSHRGSYVAGGLGHLAVLDLERKSLTPTRSSFHRIRLGAGAGRSRAVPRCRAQSSAQHRGARPRVGKPSCSAKGDTHSRSVRTCASATISTTVRPVEFPTTDGKTAFGLFYPPHNPDYAGPADEKPPLLVKCHGGPTGAASSSLNLVDAVLDQPRHRGARRQLRRQHRLRP